MINRRKFLAGISGLALGYLLLDGFLLEQYFFEVNTFDIGNENKRGKALKIIQLTDLHLQKVGWHHKKLAERINQEQADIILFTGDSLDRAGKIPVLDEFLSLLNDDTPKLAILGNWEYWGDVDMTALRNVYQKHNTELLVNQSTMAQLKGIPVQFTGTDCELGGNPADSPAFQNLSAEQHHFVLMHCPTQIEFTAEEIAKAKAPLNIKYVFSGHTHGGQITLLGWTPFVPRGVGKYRRGWYDYEKLRMYVSKGFGTSVLPIRFCARAELSVFNYYTGEE